ncbi:hypothetical protein DACRYDRAFT_110440 [Dacryopinax primogenitus]|uniref:Uncharacterized protein n=1 Tax=Dacryopinax primogenitus (strain DJM 731) TaxID=1858805 RepID=M5FQF7_DACPD|nr:uncharacterized protein DACRYDRAFT_110440 [Dacryopinax primogenitus]EJT99120.1 hypothetical protein DACRYDRAFT_110440 [Dacryopinax primogenitus]
MDILCTHVPAVTLSLTSFDQWLTIQEQLAGHWNKTDPTFANDYQAMQQYFASITSESNGWMWDGRRCGDSEFVFDLATRLRNIVVEQVDTAVNRPTQFNRRGEMVCYFAAFAIVSLIQRFVVCAHGTMGHQQIESLLAKRFSKVDSQ